MTNFIKLLDTAQTAAETSALTESAGRVPSEHINLMWSTLVTGLVVVFLILVLLVIVLWALGKVMNIKIKPKKSAKAEPQNAAAPVSVPAPVPAAAAEEEALEDDSEIIAVIAAAIAAYGESEGKQYKIASVKRKEKALRSNWSAAGIAENTRPF